MIKTVINRGAILLALALVLNIIGCQKRPATTLKEPILDMEFILVQKGSFNMGNNQENGTTNPGPKHKVIISTDFWLGKTEVTQDQWQRIMGDKELHPEKPSPFRGVHPDYPVVNVSYFDVERFLGKLNKLSGEYQFRLPTEAEWEYACRAGTTTAFSFGSKLNDNLANFNAKVPSEYAISGIASTHPEQVGSYAPNQWGLYDMHGNVWEWVSDWYGIYPDKEVTDPKGPINGKEKIIRGGSWYFGADNARSFHRRTHQPRLWGFSIGFRIVCEKSFRFE
ncbi:formylglycine-generating enzyme family protein [Muriicola sp. Z0-33]|uniref:formylglycine-generating enzyme family protein n=1 Tax=Muriicola sp. Z0-33 TaxID=2816957 RepID=UPI0022388388|nr:formylglycine-generating enzyme family protein [Muriicola sp. Z0-33]MCW5516005.1 SUMF1/EgtB/PvdO family nonheme iron enzyme [Muriicola sp. Z0-33]